MQIVRRKWSFTYNSLFSEYQITQLSQAINSPSVPTAVGKCKISIEKNKEKIEKYICLFLFIDILLLISNLLATWETSVK